MPRVYAEVAKPDRIGFDLDAYEKAIAGHIRAKVEPEIKEAFRDIISNWSREHTPEFRTRTSVGPNPSLPGGYGIALDVMVMKDSMAGKIWHWVDKGTKQHLIPKAPKEDGFLYYRESYDAKVRGAHGVLSKGTGRSSGALRQAKQVTHPGITPRDFSKFIGDNYRKRFLEHMKVARIKARKAAGKR